ncbi:unnamed protein product [Zymoseptoria tritici ST99CH_1A5]|uniref:Anaphase-promoting complex subunit 11 n=2 Tax=Zymoseptoria tritici TaxID=1047171 RepID=A0A1X7RE85_ZYMT9|nr:unnamed protein product [Zymoseptoria tritici ST99CH_3D7]SMY19394.1 unnamed protein product [Zymoseptoria tritici ST99CH_1A5]
MKMTIKHYHAVAEWKWDHSSDEDKCSICSTELEGTCGCHFPGNDCPITIGQCTHIFHMHCIDNWLGSSASQGRCPLCRQVFQQAVAAVSSGTAATPNNGRGTAVAATTTTLTTTPLTQGPAATPTPTTGAGLRT